jgi:hypothetical protein
MRFCYVRKGVNANLLHEGIGDTKAFVGQTCRRGLRAAAASDTKVSWTFAAELVILLFSTVAKGPELSTTLSSMRFAD